MHELESTERTAASTVVPREKKRREGGDLHQVSKLSSWTLEVSSKGPNARRGAGRRVLLLLSKSDGQHRELVTGHQKKRSIEWHWQRCGGDPWLACCCR